MSGKKTKAQILRGTKRQESFYVAELDWHVMLRPLTDGEWADVQALMLSGQKITVSESNADEQAAVVDLGGFVSGEAEARSLAVSCAIADEDWTVAEVKAIPRGDRQGDDERGPIEKISDKVFEITGVSLEAVSSFRDQRRGPANSDAAPDGDAPSADTSGADADAG